MVRWTGFPLCVVSKWLILTPHKLFRKTFRVVSYYSTAATSDTAYLIGGYQDASYSTTIAEFKNNQWRKLGNLNQGRRHHGSISVGSRTMVVGGYTAGYE